MAADTSPLDSIRNQIAELNERERKLLGLMGLVMGVMIVLLPGVFISRAIGEREAQNDSIRTLLRDIGRARPELAIRRAEEEAARARYARPAPPLGSFIEAQARAIDPELQIREVNDQPERVIDVFRRRNVRATMPNVDLRKAIDMLAAMENSDHPVALERLQIEHFRSGSGYNVQLGVIAYELEESEATGDDEATMDAMRAAARMGRAGPPAP